MLVTIVFTLLIATIVFVAFWHSQPAPVAKRRLPRLPTEEEKRQSKVEAVKASGDALSLSSIPGPPEEENGHMLLIAQAGGQGKWNTQVHEEYGPLVRYRFGPNTPVVSIADPDLVHSSLTMGERPSFVFGFLEDIVGESVSVDHLEGKHLPAMRRIARSPFSHGALKKQLPSLDAFVKELIPVFDDAMENKTELPLQQTLLKSSLKASLLMCVGPTALQTVDFIRFYSSWEVALSFSLSKQNHTSSAYTEEEYQESVEFLRETLKQLCSSEVETGSGTLLEMLKTSNDPSTNAPFTFGGIASTLLGYIIGAYHTVVVAASWNIYCLCLHPEEQQKVIKEVDSVLGKEETDETPPVDAFGKLKYMHMTLKESMRLHPPATFASRGVPVDVVLEPKSGKIRTPVLIPAGTTLVYALNVLLQDKDQWTDPLSFNPSRFASPTHHAQSYVAFGVGVRACPGERMAWLQLKLLLSSLFKRYTFELATPKEDVVAVEKFVLWAKNDIKVFVHSRNEQQQQEEEEEQEQQQQQEEEQQQEQQQEEQQQEEQQQDEQQQEQDEQQQQQEDEQQQQQQQPTPPSDMSESESQPQEDETNNNNNTENNTEDIPAEMVESSHLRNLSNGDSVIANDWVELQQ